MVQDNTSRFSNRVKDYIEFRPTYPKDMVRVLSQNIGFNNTKVVADIGSGTGISSVPFLQNGNMVYGVEPNNEMREAQENLLRGYRNFVSVNGTAEHTKLKPESVGLIFCGQSFHWFDKQQSKKEFLDILEKSGNIVLAWNSRCSRTDFQKGYEQILVSTIEEYGNARHRDIEDLGIKEFFSPKSMQTVTLKNEQIFNLNGLKGRLKSSSYCPKEGEDYENLMEGMEKLFERHKVDNSIVFNYDTKIYWC